MNPPVPPAAPVAKSQRRLARWVLAGLLLLIAPIVVVGVGVASMFRLSGDAAALRQEVMAATDAQWSTQVQVSAGWCTLATASPKRTSSRPSAAIASINARVPSRSR